MNSELHIASAPTAIVEWHDFPLGTRFPGYIGTVTFLLILAQFVFKQASKRLKFCNFRQGPQLRNVTERYGMLQICSDSAGFQGSGAQEFEPKPGSGSLRLRLDYTFLNFVTRCALPISVT